MTDNERIATLTTGAIKTTTESAVKAIMAAVEAAEAKTKEMREAAEHYVAQFEQVTSELAENVNAHVVACQTAIDTFQAHHLKILNTEPKDESLVRLSDEISSKAQVQSSRVNGKH